MALAVRTLFTLRCMALFPIPHKNDKIESLSDNVSSLCHGGRGTSGTEDFARKYDVQTLLLGYYVIIGIIC